MVRIKSRRVAGGHLTEPSPESNYSGVVSLRGITLVSFLAELNHLKLIGAEVRNDVLEANTREKFYIVGGPTFQDLEGHVLVIYKALYGLRISGFLGTSMLLMYLGLLVSLHARRKMIFGCVRTKDCMNINK
jgi:hypothetical protein